MMAEGRIRLTGTYYNDKKIAFAPLSDLGNYLQVGQMILESGHSGKRIPSGDETAWLTYFTFFGHKKRTWRRASKEFGRIIDRLSNDQIHVYNRVFWTPKGKYVLLDSAAKGRRSEDMDIATLDQLLKTGTVREYSGVMFSENGRLRFAPMGAYRLGEQSSECLKEDPGVIAEYGISGAVMLSQVAGLFRCSPYVGGVTLKEGQEMVRTASAMKSCCGDRLELLGNLDDHNFQGSACGVWIERNA